MEKFRVVLTMDVVLEDPIQAQVSTMGLVPGPQDTLGTWPVISDVDRVGQAVMVVAQNAFRPALMAAGIAMTTAAPTVLPPGADGTYPTMTIPG